MECVIKTKTTLNHVGQYSSYPIETTLSYDRADPYAISMLLSSDASEETWTFGRELLTKGIEDKDGAGIGDVRIWCCSASCSGDHVYIALTGDDGMGSMLFRAQREVLARFLRRTYVMVPRGYESQHIDLDAVIDQLLAESS